MRMAVSPSSNTRRRTEMPTPPEEKEEGQVEMFEEELEQSVLGNMMEPEEEVSE